MYYVWLSKPWWRYAKKQGWLKNNGRCGVLYIKSKRIGLLNRLYHYIKGE